MRHGGQKHRLWATLPDWIPALPSTSRLPKPLPQSYHLVNGYNNYLPHWCSKLLYKCWLLRIISLDRVLLALSSLGPAGWARPHFLLCSLMVKSLITKLTTLCNCIPHQRKIAFEGLSPHHERDWPNSLAPFCLCLTLPAFAWGLGARTLTFRMLPVAGPTLLCAPSFYKPHWKMGLCSHLITWQFVFVSNYCSLPCSAMQWLGALALNLRELGLQPCPLLWGLGRLTLPLTFLFFLWEVKTIIPILCEGCDTKDNVCQEKTLTLGLVPFFQSVTGYWAAAVPVLCKYLSSGGISILY